MEVMEAKERLPKETKRKAKEKDRTWDEVKSVLNKEEVEEVDFLQPYLHLLSPSLIELLRFCETTRARNICLTREVVFLEKHIADLQGARAEAAQSQQEKNADNGGSTETKTLHDHCAHRRSSTKLQGSEAPVPINTSKKDHDDDAAAKGFPRACHQTDHHLAPPRSRSLHAVSPRHHEVRPAHRGIGAGTRGHNTVGTREGTISTVDDSSRLGTIAGAYQARRHTGPAGPAGPSRPVKLLPSLCSRRANDVPSSELLLLLTTYTTMKPRREPAR
ncbi:F-box only protein 7 [Hordeum vulgare]|nr:F-box only protein 7 [Hordeum vulgare]